MSGRIHKVNESVREVISEAVGELSDPRLGFVTITHVDVARDFRAARVYFTALGDDQQRERSLSALRSSHGLLQRAVAREVKLRNTPQLEFVYDTTTDTALRITELLDDDPHHQQRQ